MPNAASDIEQGSRLRPFGLALRQVGIGGAEMVTDVLAESTVAPLALRDLAAFAKLI
jgi:hypothetical protein